VGVIRFFFLCCTLLFINEVYSSNSSINNESSEIIVPSKGRYLMITPPEFDSVLSYFAHYKRDIGFDVRVVTTDITGKTASSIKNYIQNQYNNVATRPVYVLLVGDTDKIT